jgi:hypothetical protein
MRKTHIALVTVVGADLKTHALDDQRLDQVGLVLGAQYNF